MLFWLGLVGCTIGVGFASLGLVCSETLLLTALGCCITVIAVTMVLFARAVFRTEIGFVTCCLFCWYLIIVAVLCFGFQVDVDYFLIVVL